MSIKLIKPIPELSKEQIKMFNSRWVKDMKTGCHVWQGSPSANGYPRFKVRGVTYYAHRLAYVLKKGQIPEGLVVDHLCLNKMCVNDKHLEAVTSRVNTLRYTEAQLLCVRGHVRAGNNITTDRLVTRRRCRACKNTRTFFYKNNVEYTEEQMKVEADRRYLKYLAAEAREAADKRNRGVDLFKLYESYKKG